MKRALGKPFGGGLALLIAICFSLLTARALGQSSGTGTITGQVSNVSTRAYLQGAVVELSGTDQSAITDREGRYELTGVPAGPATLIVTFTGLDLQRFVVPVSAGQKVVRDVQLTSNIYQLDKFTVAGMREGTALAATLQRQAPNVKNIVSADTFGNPADGNLGDLLVRLPAISANFVNGDVRSVSIRGTGPDINSVTMDGQRVASAQSANPGRAFEFEQVSMGNLESIEVTKAPTPDMEADSIGGSVNLITKSAFGHSGRAISYTLAGITTSRYKIYKDNKLLQPIKGVGPSMALSYSEVFGEKKNLGIHWNGTYISKPGGEVGQGITFEQNAANSHPYMRVYAGPRQQGAAPQIRAAMGLKVDYKFSEQTVFAFNTSYAFFHEENDSRNLTLTTREEVAAFNAAGQRTGRGTIMPGYNEYYTEASPSASNPADTFVSLSNSGNDKSGRTFLLSPSARHRINGYDIDYNLSYSNAATYYDISQNGSKYDSNPKGTLAYRISGIGFILDRRTGDPRKVSYRQTSGPDMYNLNNYEGLTLSQNDRRGFDRILSAKLNVRKNLELAVPMFVKTGLNVRKQSRHLWSQNRSYTYTGPDGVMGNADDRQDLAQFLDVSGKHRRENDIYRPPPFMDQYAVARHQKNNPELWKENITTSTVSKLQNQQEADETVSSAYVMGNVRFGPLSVLAGVRLEETKVNGEGPMQYVSPAEAARRAAWVGPVTDTEARRRAEAEWGGRDQASGKYRNSFPGIHFKYEPMKGLVLRASYSNGIGRPSFGNLIPLTVPNDVNQTVSVRNTNLKPQYADNLDLSAEYYFEPAGLLSAGVYRKNLTNFIFTDNSRIVAAGPNNGFEGEYEGYRLSTQANGGSARIEGIEFNYQQQLKLNRLPKWAQGFGVYGNYTYMRTEGDYGNTASATFASKELAGFLPRTANLGVSYIGHPWDIRLQWVFRGHRLTTNSTNAAALRYDSNRLTHNVKIRYLFSEKYILFIDVENITAVPYVKTVYRSLGSNLPSDTGTVSPRWVGGLQGRF